VSSRCFDFFFFFDELPESDRLPRDRGEVTNATDDDDDDDDDDEDDAAASGE
jgi:hypothetical protein